MLTRLRAPLNMIPNSYRPLTDGYWGLREPRTICACPSYSVSWVSMQNIRSPTFVPNRRSWSTLTEIPPHTEQSETICWMISEGRSTSDVFDGVSCACLCQTTLLCCCSGDNAGCLKELNEHLSFHMYWILSHKSTSAHEAGSSSHRGKRDPLITDDLVKAQCCCSRIWIDLC